MEKELISAEDIVTELVPLLKDFFVTECLSYGDTIEMIFSSGQKTQIVVEA